MNSTRLVNGRLFLNNQIQRLWKELDAKYTGFWRIVASLYQLMEPASEVNCRGAYVIWTLEVTRRLNSSGRAAPAGTYPAPQI